MYSHQRKCIAPIGRLIASNDRAIFVTAYLQIHSRNMQSHVPVLPSSPALHCMWEASLHHWSNFACHAIIDRPKQRKSSEATYEFAAIFPGYLTCTLRQKKDESVQKIVLWRYQKTMQFWDTFCVHLVRIVFMEHWASDHAAYLSSGYYYY